MHYVRHHAVLYVIYDTSVKQEAVLCKARAGWGKGERTDWPRGQGGVCSTQRVVLTFDVMDSLVIGDFQCPREACLTAIVTWGRINSRATWTDLERLWPGDMQAG